MNGQTNFMAIILRKDNPRLQQAFDEFDETVAFLFDWTGGLVGYDWRSASQGLAVGSATIGDQVGYGCGGLREGVSLIYFLHLHKGFGIQRMSWSEVKFAR